MARAGVADHLREHHGETLSAVETVMGDVADEVGAPATREAVVAGLTPALREASLLAPLVEVLEAALAAAGVEPAAEPVAAPPYVVVTARGPLLRASDGDRRLVVLLRGFRRHRAGYRPSDGLAVEATVRSMP